MEEATQVTALPVFRGLASTMTTGWRLLIFAMCSTQVANTNSHLAKGKRYLANDGMVSKVLGGWSINAAGVLQGGQPITLTCPSNTVATTAGANCYDLIVPGQPQKTRAAHRFQRKVELLRQPGGVQSTGALHSFALSRVGSWRSAGPDCGSNIQEAGLLPL